METLFYLTDVNGRRVTNSSGFNSAADWAVKELTGYGLVNVNKEPWGKFGVHVGPQPTLDVIRRLAMALSLPFEAVSKFDPEEKTIIRSLLAGMILKHEARRWSEKSR